MSNSQSNDKKPVDAKARFLSDPRFAGLTPFPSKVWLSSPTMHGDEQKWVDDAIQTNWVSTVGANINEVERISAEIIGREYAVALSAGTAALHLAIKLAAEKLYGQPRVGHGSLEGRKVFASDMTFDATDNPIAYEGGEAVFIDTEYDTWNMDPVARPARSMRSRPSPTSTGLLSWRTRRNPSAPPTRACRPATSARNPSSPSTATRSSPAAPAACC